MADKKPLSLALLQILEQYSDEDHIMTSAEIRNLIEENYDLHMERRTLYSSINVLQSLGYEISDFQDNGIGYYLKERAVSEEDVILLQNALLSNSVIGTKEAASLLDKTIVTLSTYQKEKLQAVPYAKTSSKASTSKELLSVIRAIEEGRKISFTKLFYNEKRQLAKGETVETEPLSLFMQNGRTCLIAVTEDEAVIYRIDRMKDVKLLTEDVTASIKNSELSEIASVPLNAEGGIVVEAVLKCRNSALGTVLEELGPKASVEPHGKTQSDITVKASREALQRFAMKYSDVLSVTSPKDLK